MLALEHQLIAVNAHTSPQGRKLSELINHYPKIERQMRRAALPYGTYRTKVDTTFINKCVTVIEAILREKPLSQFNKNLVKEIARQLLSGAIYRNASTDSRWRNYAKQAIVKTLLKTKEGTAILDVLTKGNPQLQAEREAYTLDEV